MTPKDKAEAIVYRMFAKLGGKFEQDLIKAYIKNNRLEVKKL